MPWPAKTSSTHYDLPFLANHGLDVTTSKGQESLSRQILEFMPGVLVMGESPFPSPNCTGWTVGSVPFMTHHQQSSALGLPGVDVLPEQFLPQFIQCCMRLIE